MSLNTSPTNHLTGAIEDLCRMILNSGALLLALPAIFFLTGRLRRTARRFAALMATFAAGRLAPPRVRAGKSGGKPSEHSFPTRRMWLVRLHQPAAFFQSRMSTFLADPQVQALIAAAPAQAGRLLRPLCRMVMVDAELPAALRLPKRPRRPRPPAPPKPPRPRQTPARGFTRAQIAQMTAADLLVRYGRLPPHFPLPIPNLNLIRRKIAAG